ncbi:hypothetical protein POM88_035719 [Heracleum sosnowskyi]|uniref:Uncharacterized protein n=1 Tax=Heracleum sosnowskyi TaxID=360622 RepID=A0AAD8HNV4_9APIA|nr:hypothetical protein POM88_035719 [Heracleum sosnowskyi]
MNYLIKSVIVYSSAICLLDEIPVRVIPLTKKIQHQLLQQQQQHQQQQHQQQQHQKVLPVVTFKSFQAAQPPEFKGSADPVEAKAWLKEMEKAFTLKEVTGEKKTEYASYFLKNEAS